MSSMRHSHQGAVSSVQEFAASHASSEEKTRASRLLKELLRIEKLEEAQRRMADFAREKVNAAVTQAKTKKLLPEAISREAQGAQNADDASEVTNGQDINAEIRVYKRAGMIDAVVAMQQEMQKSHEEYNKEREAREQKLLRQKTLGMEMRQKARLAQLQTSQEAEMDELRRSQRKEYAALVDAQATETHELTEMITGMIALGAAWAPTEKTNRPWIAQLKKSRFRTSWQLSDLQAHIAKMEADGGMSARMEELKQKADAMTQREMEEWHDKLMHQALGEHASSILSQLVAGHKIAQAKLVDHQTQKIRLAEKQANAAMKMLHGNFRLERLQLIEKVKQQQKEQEQAGELARPAQLLRRNSRRNAFASAFSGLKSGKTDGRNRHGSREAENSIAKPLEATGKLLRLLWTNPALDVLRSILRVDAGRRLFTRFIETKSKRDLIGLKLYEQVEHCKQLSAEERDKQAVMLHDAHWAVAMDTKAHSVSGAVALDLLVQRAEATLEQLQKVWLTTFLEEQGERIIQIALSSKDEAVFRSISQLDGTTFIEMLSCAMEQLPHAMCCSDMFEPGAKIVCVNRAFEVLTGFEREYDEQPGYDPNAEENQQQGEIETRVKTGTSPINRNCRFLQGILTEQEALSRVVDALRRGERAQVELTNYRLNGTSFRNLLSLRPVHDSLGRYRYCIGVLADASGLDERQRDELDRLVRILPDKFDSELQPLVYPEPTAEDAAVANAADGARIAEIESREATRILWLQNLERSFRALLQYEDEMKVFEEFLEIDNPELMKDLTLLQAVRECSQLPREAQAEASLKIALDHLEPAAVEGAKRDRVVQIVQARAGMAITKLATNCLPAFLRSPASNLVVSKVQLGSEKDSTNSARLIWAQYTPPADATDWLYPIINAVENMDVSVCIADLRIAGAPLIYVNQSFCRMTGYTKSEVLGRNCRFLQGPKTELKSISALVDAVRTAAEFSVKITNYRRSGRSFKSVLTLRPVHDSNGVYRFSISVVTHADASHAELQLHSALVQLLPRRVKLNQSAEACGPYHAERETESMYESIDEEIAQARRGDAPVRAAVDYRGYERYRSHHEGMVAVISAAPDRLLLTAIYWLCPSVAERLQTGLASPAIAEILTTLMPDIEEELAIESLEELVPSQERGSPTGIAKVLMQPQHIGSFVESAGMKLIQLVEQRTESDEEDGPKANTLLPGLGVAQNSSWLEMITHATTELPFAMIICDMFEPGARIVRVNKAFEDLTGYDAESVRGLNCRFLQGEDTEQEAVHRMVDAIRNALSIQVELTNYRKDGSQFKNLVSLRPVFDSNGRYRYSIGILSDVATLTTDLVADVNRLCRLLPKRFESSIQPPQFESINENHGTSGSTPLMQRASGRSRSPSPVRKKASEEALERSFEARNLVLAKLGWLEDIERSMLTLLESDEGIETFEEYLDGDLEGNFEQQLKLLKMAIDVRKFLFSTADDIALREDRIEIALQIARDHLEPSVLTTMSREGLPNELLRRHDQAVRVIATTCLPKFLRSSISDDVIKRIQRQQVRPFASSSHLLWDQYRVDADAMGWLYSIVSVVEMMPIGVTISDMRIAGCPLVYVNQGFCRITGYNKVEVQGRNCRFLQGPETEVASVSAVCDALRHGVDCTVKMTNYRRSGETFENLLTLRPVHDSNGVYRFCVGVQASGSRGRSLIELAHTVVELLPCDLQTKSESRCGPVHADDKDTPYKPQPPSSWGEMLVDALAGNGSVKRLCAPDLRASVRFSRQHTNALLSLGVFDLARPFTRLMWLAEPLEVFRSLMPFDCFHQIFDQHMKDFDVPKLSAIWQPLKNIAEIQGIQNMQMLDERARELYVHHITKAARGKSVQTILKELAELADTFVVQLVQDGAFIPFVESSRCLQLMEELNNKGDAINDVITAPNGTWLQMLAASTEKLPFALLAADMVEPGARIVSVNPAFEELTGYSSDEAIGRNCRFLQGDYTELDVVQDLVRALRSAQPSQFELTNYRKDGSRFRNLLHLRPVHDSNGRYRYCIGLLADADALTPKIIDELRGVFRLLPSRYEDVKVNHGSADGSFSKTGTDEGGKQRRVSRTSLQSLAGGTTTTVVRPMSDQARRSVARFYFLVDCGDSLSLLARDTSAIELFAQHLGERRNLLEFWIAATEIELEVDDDIRNHKALKLISQYLDPSSAALAVATDASTHVADEALIAVDLLTDLIPGFLVSPHAGTALDALLKLDEKASERVHNMQHARPLIWTPYRVAPDLGWLLAFVAIADELPISISIGDIAAPGNPLIYVNKRFQEETGYDAHEVLGRNCRFLQGPSTTLDSVVSLKEQLRKLQDVFIRMINYRKSGESYDSLLAMRCIRDDRAIVRLCVCMSLIVDSRIQLKDEVQLMTKLFGALPHDLGEQMDTSVSVDTLPIIRERLTRAIAHVDEPDNIDKRKPLFNFDPDVGLLCNTTQLIRIHWMTFDTSRVLAMLAVAPTRDRLLWYMHVHTPEAEAMLKEYIQHRDLLKAGKDLANLARKLKEIDFQPEEIEYLRHLHDQSITPFVQEYPRLGELVSATKNIDLLHLPVQKGWLQMLSVATEHMEFAFIACDMLDPGVRIVSANKAFEELTGYTSDSVLNSNCRFLQGQDSELNVVQEMVEALRVAQPVQVELTNYRNDGSSFRNQVSLHPVHDTNGVYRFCLGVLADVDQLNETKRASLQKLYEMMPTSIEAALQPVIKHPLYDPNALFQASSTTTTTSSSFARRDRGKLELLGRIQESIIDIVSRPASREKFREYLESVAHRESSAPTQDFGGRVAVADQPLTALAFFLEAQAFHARPATEQREHVHAIFGGYGKVFTTEGKSVFMAARDALTAVMSYKELCVQKLGEYLPGFAASTKSDDFIETIDMGSERAFASFSHLLWSKSELMADAAGWLLSLISVVETVAVSVSVSDMRIAGNPLIYVNQAFCQLTEYSRHEVLGRNCRFLQGLDTEVESMSVIVDAIRHGVATTVQITNYKRSGETFKNLLSLRAVHDSNGVYRYCVAIQCESPMERLSHEIFTALRTLLPTQVDVGDAPACGRTSGSTQGIGLTLLGPAADHGENDLKDFESIRAHLKNVAEGFLPSPRASDVQDPIRFENNHQLMLSELAEEQGEGSDVGEDDIDDLDDGRSDAGSEKTALTSATRMTSGTGYTLSMGQRKKGGGSQFGGSTRSSGLMGSDGHIKRGPVQERTAAAAVTANSKTDAGIVYTKLMWLRSRSPQFIHHLLSFPVAEAAWKRSMVERQQPTSRLTFCCVAAQLINLSPEEQRVAIFKLARVYLGLRDHLRVEDISALVRQRALEVISELALTEFGSFLSSRACNELILQMRELDPPPGPELYLEPPKEALEPSPGTNHPPAVLVRVINAALQHFPMAVLICDRSLGGFPIVGASAGITRVTGYPLKDIVGWNCRILQGPETDPKAITQVVSALRIGISTNVSLTNYRIDGTPFTNQLFIGDALNILPNSDLVAAVLRMPPPPLQAARSDAEVAEILGLFSSCNARLLNLSNQESNAKNRVMKLLQQQDLIDGKQWMRDAEPTLNRMLRLAPVRAHFLNSALQGLPGDASSSKSTNEELPDQSQMMQEVQLMMHSNNVLADSEHYLKTACGLWMEIHDLNKILGWEFRVALQQLSHKYISVDRGTKKHADLWKTLRNGFYDALATRERELRENEVSEEPTIEDLRDTLQGLQRRKAVNLGSAGTAAAVVEIMRAKMRSSRESNEKPEDGAAPKRRVGVGFAVDQTPAEDDAMSVSSAKRNDDDGMSVAGSHCSSDQDDVDELLETQNKVAAEEAEHDAAVTKAERLKLTPESFISPSGMRSGRRGGVIGNSEDGSFKGSDGGVLSGSQTSSMSTSDDSLKELQMLQHVLLRVLTIHLLPYFLNSMHYGKCLTEVKEGSESIPMCALLEIELQSLQVTQPRTSEGWAGLLIQAARFLPNAFIVCDLSLPGVPIIAVNAAFELLTGYNEADIVGGSCRFLQGEKTDPEAVAAISNAIRTHRGCHVSLINYKKDGTQFLNLLSLKPIFDSDGLGRFMLGCLVEVQSHYSASKAQLRQVDRLFKLTSSNLAIPSNPEAKERMLSIKRTVLRPRARRTEVQHTAHDTQLMSGSESVEKKRATINETPVLHGNPKATNKTPTARRASAPNTGSKASSPPKSVGMKARSASLALTNDLAKSANAKILAKANPGGGKSKLAGPVGRPPSSTPGGKPSHRPTSARPTIANSKGTSNGSQASANPDFTRNPTPPGAGAQRRPASARAARYSDEAKRDVGLSDGSRISGIPTVPSTGAGGKELVSSDKNAAGSGLGDEKPKNELGTVGSEEGGPQEHLPSGDWLTQPVPSAQGAVAPSVPNDWLSQPVGNGMLQDIP